MDIHKSNKRKLLHEFDHKFSEKKRSGIEYKSTKKTETKRKQKKSITQNRVQKYPSNSTSKAAIKSHNSYVRILPNISLKSSYNELTTTQMQNASNTEINNVIPKSISISTSNLTSEHEEMYKNERSRKKTTYIPILPKTSLPSNDSVLKNKGTQDPTIWKRRWRNEDNESGLRNWCERFDFLFSKMQLANDFELNNIIKNFPITPDESIVNNCIRTWCDTQTLSQYEWQTCFVCGKRKLKNELKNDNISSTSISYLIKKLRDVAAKNMQNPKQRDAYYIFLNTKTPKNCVLCKRCYNTLLTSNPQHWMMCYGYFRQPSCTLPILSEFEKLLIAIYRPHMTVYSLKSYTRENQKVIRGNCCVYEQDIKLIADTLPLSPDQFHLFVQILFLGTGPFPKQYLQRLVQVRLREIYTWLFFLKDNNPLYKDVTIESKSEYAKKLKLDNWNIPSDVQKYYHNIPDAALIEDQSSIAKKGDEDVELTFHRLTVANPAHAPLTDKQILDRVINQIDDINDHTYVSHPRKFGDNKDKWFYEKAFPTVFPYGTGGRKSIGNVGLRRWISEWILDDGQTQNSPIQQDSVFLSVLFGMTQKEDLDHTIFVMKQTNRLENSSKIFKDITLDDIYEVQNLIQKNCQKQLYKNKAYRQVMQSLRSVGHSVVGTTVAAIENKNIAVGLLQSAGLPHMFFTANFDDRRNPLVAIFAGYKIQLTDEGLVACMSKAERETVAANDPVAVADFAWNQLYCMIRTLFGFDLRTGAMMENGGILSYVHDIVAVPHTQGRGGIHIHLLLKFWGHPNISELQNLLQDKVFACKYLKFVDNISQCGPPEINDSIPRKASTIHDFVRPLYPPNDNASDASKIEYRLKFLQAQQLCGQINLTHHHCDTCFKKVSCKKYYQLKGDPKLQDKYCRMGAPWPLCDKTRLCKDNTAKTPDHVTYEQKRNNPWSVQTNYCISTVMNINSSCHMFKAGEAGIASAMYACHYMTSYHSQDYQFWEGLEQAFQEEMKNQTSLSPQAILMRMFFAYLRTQQVCLSMAVWYMRRYPQIVTSIKYSILRFQDVMNYANKTWNWINANKVSLLTQYLLRCKVEKETRQWPIILFLRHYYPDTCTKREFPSVPILMPYYNVPTLKFDTIQNNKENPTSMFIVIFFTAYNSKHELDTLFKNQYSIAEEILVHQRFPDDKYWSADDKYFMREYINNLIKFEHANECIKLYKHTIPHYEAEARLNLNDDEEEHSDDEPEDIVSELQCVTTGTDIQYLAELSKVADIHAFGAYEHVLKIAKSLGVKKSPITLTSGLDNQVYKSSEYGNEVRNFLNMIQTQTLMNDLYDFTPDDLVYNRDRDTPIFHWIKPSPNWFDTIHSELLYSVAVETTLTLEQAIPFFLYGAQLIATEQNIKLVPLDMILCGGAGTGKSHVLFALLRLLEKMNQPAQRIQRGAFTGAAASNIGGCTLHHMYNWEGKTTHPQTTEPKCLFVHRLWELVWIQFVDEFGVLDARLFNGICDTLNFYRKNVQDQIPTVYHNMFGGVSSIFAGDPNQLGPVRSRAVYAQPKSPQSLEQATQTESQHTKAFHEWRSIPWCIYLSEPKRFQTEYCKFIKNFEKGIVSSNHLKELNARRVPNLAIDDIQRFYNATAIVQHNILRTRMCTRHIVEVNDISNIYWHVAHDKNNKNIDPHELRKMNSHRTDMDTRGLLHVIPLVEGEEYLLSKNIVPQWGLANGNRVHVVKIHNKGMDNEFLECEYLIKNSQSKMWPGMKQRNRFSLYPTTETINLSYKDPGKRSISIPVQRTQYSLIPAFAVTIYKAQGQTLHNIITTLRVCRSREEVYVVLSRATNFSDLLLLDQDPLTFSDIMLKENTVVADERKRLQELDTKTRSFIWNNFPSQVRNAYDRYCNDMYNINKKTK